MPRRRPSNLPIGEASDPSGFPAILAIFLEHLAIKNYSQTTIDGHDWNLKRFVAWCEERTLTRPSEVTRPIIERYQRSLYYYRMDDGEPLSFRSQHMRLSSVKLLFQWLVRSRQILYNPAAEIELPKIERRLPKHILTAAEAERVLAQPDIHTPLGIRDRAILEVLYSTGIRRGEITRLRLYDLDVDRGTVTIRQGKGKKDRVIPIGERAIAWTRRYVADVRPALVSPPDDGTLFLGGFGYPFSPDVLGHIVRDYVSAANIGKTGACHLFRHTMATLMLEGGADLRFIQPGI